MATAAQQASVRQQFPFVTTKLTDIENTVTAAQKNIRNGPAVLTDIYVDNTIAANAEAWVKVYDIVDGTLVAGTSNPMIGFPVKAVGTNPVAGIQNVKIGRGLRFVNGISVLASKEDGDEMAAPPTEAVDAVFVTER